MSSVETAEPKNRAEIWSAEGEALMQEVLEVGRPFNELDEDERLQLIKYAVLTDKAEELLALGGDTITAQDGGSGDTHRERLVVATELQRMAIEGSRVGAGTHPGDTSLYNDEYRDKFNQFALRAQTEAQGVIVSVLQQGNNA